MSELNAFELEGRINGLREVLTMIVVHLIENGADDLGQALEERLAVMDNQEDPGAVPDATFAVDAAATREIHLLVEEARSRMRES